jgi:P-type E1-E2 ATPase
MKLEHSLLVAVSVDDELLGVIGLNDPIRPESKKLISQLRKLGVQEIMLVTGDNLQTAQVIAEQVGITSIYSHAKPEDKLRITREAMEDAKGSVIVVGDGINDAPALAAADVGVAMGARGATAASEAADVVIVDDSIDRLTTAIAISQRSQKKAVQSAGIGMALSLGIMLTGSFGITSVSQGALAQELIDVVAILWALTSLRDK